MAVYKNGPVLCLVLFRRFEKGGWKKNIKDKVGEKRMMPTPEGHEDSKEDSGWVVKEVAGTGSAAGCAQVPIIADTIAKRAHSKVLCLITHLQTETKSRQKIDQSDST